MTYQGDPRISQDLVEAGVKAEDSGDLTTAKEYFVQALEHDTDNVSAWLHLSEVVDSPSDRRMCLENALAIEPENREVRETLESMDEAGHVNVTNDLAISRQVTPLTTAASILYPDRLTQRWHWQDDIVLNQSGDVSTQSEYSFNDIWEQETEICAYCAEPLQEISGRCPNCNRKLSYLQFSFRKRSNSFMIYWVLVLATAQLYLIQAFIDIVRSEPLAAVFWHGLLFFLFVFLTVLLILRHPAGYVGSTILLLVASFATTATLAVDGLGSQVLESFSSRQGLIELSESPWLTLFDPVLDLLQPFQLITMVLALIVGIFFVGPDFERRRVRIIAQVDRGLSAASEYFSAGKEYVAKGMWASAVLNFRRAVAKEPNRPSYQRYLGLAYGKLGFYERALDVLESARLAAFDENQRLEIEADLQELRNRALEVQREY